MIQMAGKCPYCGATHNPLIDPSLRSDSGAAGCDESSGIADTGNRYTWLCQSCGETYQLDVSSPES